MSIFLINQMRFLIIAEQNDTFISNKSFVIYHYRFGLLTIKGKRHQHFHFHQYYRETHSYGVAITFDENR